MSFIPSSYLKENCTDFYDINNLYTIADNIVRETNNKYTQNMALKLISRYANINTSKNKIFFDINNRHDDKTFDSLKYDFEKLNIHEKNQTEKENSKSKKSGGFGDMSYYEAKHKEENLESITKIQEKEKSKSKKSGGFGDMSYYEAKHKEENLESISKIQEKEKENSKSKKSGGFGDMSYYEQKQKTEKIESKKSGGFGDMSYYEQKQKTEKIESKKSGGFGDMSYYEQKQKTENLNLNSKPNYKNENENMTNYENKNITNNKKIRLEPFGTDNYDDINIKDDIWETKEKERSLIYRKLASQYYPAQRSPEWFQMRETMITASDGGVIVGMNPYEPDYSFIIKKVHGKPFETSQPCYHGKKLEQVATMIYEYRMNVKVMEFGLCQHPIYNFLGASPDGIVSEYKLKTKSGKSWEELENELKLIKKQEDKFKFLTANCYKTKYVGRMLEIKCPTGREILMDKNAPEVYGVHGEKITQLYKDVKKGVCPAYYWVQVQLQLQCCNLDECDFWQMKITEYKTRKEFEEDMQTKKEYENEKGALIQIIPKNQITNNMRSSEEIIYNFAGFIYQPRINMTLQEIDEWIFNTLENLNETHPDYVFDKILYWRVEQSRNYTIKRDDEWFNKNLSKFRESWDLVLFFRKEKELSLLLKKYLLTFPLDNFKKIKEPIKDTILNTMKELYKNNKTSIKALERETKNIIINDTYDANQDIEFIKTTLQNKKDDEKIIEIIKRLKFDLLHKN